MMNRIAVCVALLGAGLLAGCGPDPYVRPDPMHEVHRIPYNQPERPATAPPGPSMGPMNPPPPAMVEGRSEPPTPRHVWIPGYYRWRNGGWIWVPGGWWVPERSRSWMPGQWIPGPGGQALWKAGHWQ